MISAILNLLGATAYSIYLEIIEKFGIESKKNNVKTPIIRLENGEVKMKFNFNDRQDFLNELANLIFNLPAQRIQRVAIDGVDGAGKTVLVNELAPLIETLGRPVIRASVDGFHNPREVRYRLGKSSPEGFYRESYNYRLFKEVLLDPLSPNGSGRYKVATYDVDKDSTVEMTEQTAHKNSILIVDGIFLHREELKS